MQENQEQAAENLAQAIREFEARYPDLNEAMSLLGFAISDYERTMRQALTSSTVDSNVTELVAEYGDLGRG